VTSARETAEIIGQRLADSALPSDVLAVVALSDSESVVSVTPEIARNHLFEWGSLTKAITGLLLARLVEEGVVALDDPVTRYLPVPNDPYAHQITLLGLATHSSKLARLPGNFVVPDLKSLNPYGDYTDAHLLAAWQSADNLAAEPDGRYSNFGFGLLGVALSEAAGQAFDELTVKWVLRPLGAMSASFPNEDASQDEWATGFGDGSEPMPHWIKGGMHGAGGIFGTADDLFAVTRAFAQPSASELGSAIVMAQRPWHQTSERNWFGLGCVLVRASSGRVLCWIDGATAGFSSAMAVDAAFGAGAAALCNFRRKEPDTRNVVVQELAKVVADVGI
jgi:D-alanyl-D-alanine-carboxypeptidase/D-alanyl-D-alanine-endopeptidase